MGTRGIVGFVVDGTPLLTYNHMDSYPEYLGVETLHWLREHLVQLPEGVVLSPEVRGPLQSLEVVEESAQPTARQLKKLRSKGITGASGVSTGADFCAWLRECQGDLTATIKSGFWIGGGEEFAKESLFCEWGFVIDADRGALDVYEGFNEKATPTEGLWAGVRNPDTEERTRRDGSTWTRGNYQPIQRIVSFSFAEIAELRDDGKTPRLDDEEFISAITRKSRLNEEEI